MMINMQINIKNIHINSISMIGSMNVGKTVLANNHSKFVQKQKSNYEENEIDEEKIEKLVPPPLPVPFKDSL